MNTTFLVPDYFTALFSSEAGLRRRTPRALTIAEYQAGRVTNKGTKKVFGALTTTELGTLLIDHGLSVTSPVAFTPERLTKAKKIVEEFRASRELISAASAARATPSTG